MNKEKINAGIDRMAEEAKETMNLLSDKIDRATRCGNEKAARIKRSAKAGLRRTDRRRTRDRRPHRRAYSGQTVRINRRIRNRTAAPFGDAAACMKPQAKQPAARPLLLERIAPTAAGAIDSQATRDMSDKKILQY